MQYVQANKQQALGADPRVMRQINFSGNLERDNNDDKTQMFIILGEVKEIIFDFSQWAVKVL